MTASTASGELRGSCSWASRAHPLRRCEPLRVHDAAPRARRGRGPSGWRRLLTARGAMSIVTLSILALPSLGCATQHLQKNAPGHVDLAARPVGLVRGETEQPRDPGERGLALLPGGYLAGGAAKTDDGTRATAVSGLELSLQYGSRDTSHKQDGAFDAPPRRIGLNAGGDLFATHRRRPDRLYGELQYSEELTYLALGWAYSPLLERSGPQVTVGWTMFYARSSTMLGYGTDFTGGIVIKIPTVWTWSK